MVKTSVDSDYGIYRAEVAGNSDSLGTGRVQVRIPCFHGDATTGIPDRSLPYATVVVPGGSSTSGMFVVPEKGSVVFVVFENGNRHSPIVLGGVSAVGRQRQQYLSESGFAYQGEGDSYVGTGATDTSTVKQPYGRMVPAFTPDMPLDVRSDSSNRIVYQSPKGSRILIRDRDEAEGVEMTDANGQSLVMSSPMQRNQTRDNKHHYSKPAANLAGRALTVLSNALGQILYFISSGTEGSAAVADKERKMGIEIRGATGTVRIFNQAGSSVDVELGDGVFSVRTVGARIDLSEDSIELNADRIVIEGSSVTVNGSNLGLQGNISVNGNLRSNSRITGNLDDIEVSSPSPTFTGDRNVIDPWESEV